MSAPPPQEAIEPAPRPVAAPPEPPADDPPGRVARLGFLEGQVSFRPASDTEWAPATPNRPITTGDRVWSDADGRAEVEAGAVDLRIERTTELDVVRLDDRAFQVRIPQGVLVERVRAIDGDNDEIDAPNAAVVPSAPGEYRIDVSPDGATTSVTVLAGAAAVTAAGSSFQVHARQTATVRGVETPTFDLTDAGPPDDFDRWSEGRDAREDRVAQSRQYVNAEMPGAEDLDEYGRWTTDAQYGPVWYPTTVQVGWAPYRNGHWEWVGRWGWTWVDDAPWGWAPFHYGRWAYVDGAWAWCPGRVVVERPVYAPALVVFVGGEGGGGGNVGWFPLAPGEVYRPAYPTSVNYVRQVNVTNVTNVTNITNVTNVTNVNTVNTVTYRNRVAPGAMTVVPEHALANGEPVAPVVIAPSRELVSSQVVATAPSVAPTHASLAFHGAMTAGPGVGRTASLPPAMLAGRQVVALHAPPPAPIPFALQEHALAANAGRPLAQTQVVAIRQSMPPRADVLPVRPALIVTKTANAGSGNAAVRTNPPLVSPPTNAATLTPGRGTIPPSGPPPAVAVPPRGAQPPLNNPGGVPPTIARPPLSPLDQSYQAEQTKMEARHQQEFAQPPHGESIDALSQRHEAEHQDLEQRYQKARATGQTQLPPKGKSDKG